MENSNISSDQKTEIKLQKASSLTQTNQVNLTSNKLFANKKLFPLLLRFILPALFVTFFQAMYVFADQIMMVKFIPSVHQIQDLIDVNVYNAYKDAVSKLGTAPLNMNDLTRAAVSISAPITVILNGITLLVSMGVAVSFSRALGKNNQHEVEQVWSTGFISNATIGLTISLFILAISPVWLHSSATGNGQLNTNDPAIKAFSIAFQNEQVKLAQGYVYVLCGFNVFQVMTQMYYFLAQSEGRQLFISIVPTMCNVINVVLDYVLIVFARLALIGSAVATVVGWLINFIAYVIYNQILTKQNKTHLVLQKLRFRLFNWKLFTLIMLIGLASFMRNSSYAFSNSLFQTYLVNVTNSTHYFPQVSNSPNEFQSIYGSVTPISNLALQSVWGVIQGGRTVASYKYGQKDYKAIKQIYWYVAAIATTYGLFVFILFSFALDQVLLTNLFNVDPNKLNYTVYILRITMIQSLFLATGTTAQLYFQSTQRIAWSWFSSIVQNLILFVPLLFVFQAGANQIASPNNQEAAIAGMNLFVLLPVVCTIVAAVINIGCSLVHMYKRMGKYESEVEQNLRKPSRFIAR